MSFFQKNILITQDLKLKIAHHKFFPQTYLPSERTMATIYQANRNTVHKALISLQRENLIRKVNNRYYINPQKKDPNIEDLMGNTTSEYFISNEELQFMKAQKSISQNLNVPLGYNIFKFNYIYNERIGTEKKPISFNNVLIPVKNKQTLKLSLNSISPLTWFRQQNKLVSKENLHIHLVKPTKEIVKLLKIQRDELVLKRTSIFSFKDQPQRVKLISFGNPKYTIICQPVKEIRRRVNQ